VTSRFPSVTFVDSFRGLHPRDPRHPRLKCLGWAGAEVHVLQIFAGFAASREQVRGSSREAAEGAKGRTEGGIGELALESRGNPHGIDGHAGPDLFS
jgi:hypothetical protein